MKEIREHDENGKLIHERLADGYERPPAGEVEMLEYVAKGNNCPICGKALTDALVAEKAQDYHDLITRLLFVEAERTRLSGELAALRGGHDIRETARAMADLGTESKDTDEPEPAELDLF